MVSYGFDKLKMGYILPLSPISPSRPRSIAPQTIGVLTKVFYMSDPDLVILARTGDKLKRVQAQA